VRARMALGAVAAIGAVAATAGGSSDTTPGPTDSAPSSAVAAQANQQPDATTGTATTTPSIDAQTTVTATGSDGKTYSCEYSVRDRVDAAQNRVTRRRKVLKARRAAVRRLVKQYPGRPAPESVVERYHE